jgi:MOSC domain-containing protein YiiM
MNDGTVVSVCISPERGQLKKEVPAANVIADYGIEHDGHAGDWGRQVTCLSFESVQRINREYDLSAGPGDFAENILISGLSFSMVCVGDRLVFSSGVVLSVSQIGKEDHPSVVSKTFGVSLLPKEGLFCRVIRGGVLKKGDTVVLKQRPDAVCRV